MEIVLLGHMGRDEAAADRLQEHKLHVLGQWENPGLVEKAKRSGGQFHVINSITNVELIADYVQTIEPDMFLTNFDGTLAAGVVDVLKQRTASGHIPELLIPCPDKSTARVEWDKFYLREIIDEIDPKYNPINFMATNRMDVSDAIDYFGYESMQVVIKPRNLTGGKGVKVMGKHFDTFSEAEKYACQVLKESNQSGVEIQEKLRGHEFTLQLITDGTTIIRPPATYDYPYREDGDTGPGTGGMGTFSMQAGEQLPFTTDEDYDEAIALMEKLLQKLKERGHDYKGVLYPTFFKTSKGLKIVEVNARGGDPELVNILDLMEDDMDYGEVLKQIATGELDSNSVHFKKLASAMIYLVSPDYGYKKGPAYTFNLDPSRVTANGTKIRFAAAEKIDVNEYQTIGSSRTIGLSALGATPWAARDTIQQAIGEGFEHSLPLQYRQEIASEAYIASLKI
jgi:phosphoribosylamine--glycine ligase